jgi:hypothetical protein
MIGAGIFVIACACLFLFMLVLLVDVFPKGFIRGFGYFLLIASTINTLLLLWVLEIILIGDGEWGLSLNEFWKVHLSEIYFIREWIYTWLWNDLLDFFWSFLPAIVFLFVRSTISTILGMWFISVSKR